MSGFVWSLYMYNLTFDAPFLGHLILLAFMLWSTGAIFLILGGLTTELKPKLRNTCYLCLAAISLLVIISQPIAINSFIKSPTPFLAFYKNKLILSVILTTLIILVEIVFCQFKYDFCLNSPTKKIYFYSVLESQLVYKFHKEMNYIKSIAFLCGIILFDAIFSLLVIPENLSMIMFLSSIVSCLIIVFSLLSAFLRIRTHRRIFEQILAYQGSPLQQEMMCEFSSCATAEEFAYLLKLFTKKLIDSKESTNGSGHYNDLLKNSDSLKVALQFFKSSKMRLKLEPIIEPPHG